MWSVESGTGAYADLDGGGTLSFTTVGDAPLSPLRLQLDGGLSN